MGTVPNQDSGRGWRELRLSIQKEWKDLRDDTAITEKGSEIKKQRLPTTA